MTVLALYYDSRRADSLSAKELLEQKGLKFEAIDVSKLPGGKDLNPPLLLVGGKAIHTLDDIQEFVDHLPTLIRELAAS